MKKLYKLFPLLLALTLVFAMLAGCASNAATSEPAKEPADTAAGTPAETETAQTPASEIRVAFVLDSSGTDGSWGQANYEAAVASREAMGLDDEHCIIMENIDAYSADAESVFEMLCQQGYDLIFGCTSGYTSAISAVAARHPEVYFAQFEGATSENSLAYSCADYNAIFLCGYTVARMSESPDLGFIACQPQASVIRALNSFAAGARYANEDATVKVLWINSWYDPAKEKEATNTLINEGFTGIGFYGGTQAVAAACEEAGVYTNGFNVDMSESGPDAVLTSFVWKWDAVFNQVITMVREGKWSNETLFPGITDGACDIAPINEKVVPADIVSDVNALREKVINHEIEAFTAPVYDNAGNCVLEEGQQFSMEDYIGMTFLLDNVIGSLPE